MNATALIILLTAVGTLVFIIGVYNAVPKEKCAWLILVVAGAALVIIGSLMQVDVEYKERISKDVDLTKVPMRGEKSFLAQTQMNYVDGKLKDIVLVPNTTMPGEKIIKK